MADPKRKDTASGTSSARDAGGRTPSRNRRRSRSRARIDDDDAQQRRSLRRDFRKQQQLLQAIRNTSIGLVVIFILVAIALPVFAQVQRALAPYRAMLAFARIERGNLPDYAVLEAVPGLPVRTFGACAGAADQRAQFFTLRSRMHAVPRHARDDLLAHVAIERASFAAALTDTAPAGPGRRFLYVAYWGSAYAGKIAFPGLTSRYTACVAGAGVMLDERDVAGWTRALVPLVETAGYCGAGPLGGALGPAYCNRYANKVAWTPVFRSKNPEEDERRRLLRFLVKAAVERGRKEALDEHPALARVALDRTEFQYLPVQSQLKRNMTFVNGNDALWASSQEKKELEGLLNPKKA